MKARLNILAAALSLIMISGLLSCSTTSRLTDGEVLYNGQRMKVIPQQGEEVPRGLKSTLTKAVNVRPNNPWPLISPYYRMPLPYGLWVYNHWNDSAKGLYKWVYDKLVEQPVLISDVRPEMRVKMLENLLDNNGYFGSEVSYDLKYTKNPKIAGIRYKIDLSHPYLIDSIQLLNNEKSILCHFIDSCARKSDYLKVGERFCVDSLEAERVYIANSLRNRGWYYFKPEYIEFLADSLMNPGSIALKLELASNMPHLASLRYKVGNITTYIYRQSTKHPGTPDTLYTKKGELIVYRPSRLRKNMIPSCITFRKDRFFSVRDMDRTQTRLSRLGIFGNIQIQAFPTDTSAVDPKLDVVITCQRDRPMEASIQANVTSKSNSYLGPGLVLGLTHNDLFGGAEKLSFQLTGSYEWQTGRNRSSVFNSYEVGFNTSLAFPRLLAPAFVRRTNRELNWTTISLGIDLLNRPHYFRMAEAKASLSYEWNYSRRVLNQLTLFKLTYTKLMHTTEAFDSVMNQNPAVALSFQSQFVPVASYTYNYEKWLERAHMNGFNFNATLMEGGNIFWALWRACGVKGEKKLLGMPFSQFIKAQAQLVYSRRFFRGSDFWLVSRVLVGAEHAYGNSSQVPYAEQFYIGGANSIRAFTVRSLGPGSYRPSAETAHGYFDQTGTFKLEMNTEFRFPIVSILHGAVFIDAGNIWLLKNDPLRPGGLLTARNFGRDIALGTGIGLRVDVGMMVIRGDLGYGLHAPYDTGIHRYFNIALKNAFAFHLAIGYPF